MPNEKPYYIGPTNEDETYSMLVGPDSFECCLGELEDRSWRRDGREAVDRLNEQHAAIERLRTALRDVLKETNFISLAAARSYIREVLEEGPDLA